MIWVGRMLHWLKAAIAGQPHGGRRIPDVRFEGPPPAPARASADVRAAIAPTRPSIARRRNAVFTAFDAAMPVSDRHGLAGRSKELARLLDGVVRQRRHAVIFGPRGSGKTSLARVFGDLADEAGCVALYGSATIGGDIHSLFQPFLAELAALSGVGNAAAAAPPPGDIQGLGNRLVEFAGRRSVLIVDEFDRIEASDTKRDIAALLKLLSDIHSPLQVVLVGIAGNVDALISAHPSLRRHLIAQGVPPIEHDDLAALLNGCAQRAGFTLEPEAVEMLASAAIGSPYHARLFGMHAALAADSANRERITFEDARAGLAEALSEWRDLNPHSCATFERALGESGVSLSMVSLAGLLAAHAPDLTPERLAEAAQDLFGAAYGETAMAGRALASLAPALCPGSSPGDFQFDDPLAPQFLVLMASDESGRLQPRGVPARTSVQAINLLQRVSKS